MNIFDKIRRSKEKLTLAVDFDGFLVEEAWPSIGNVIWYNFIFVRSLQEKGHKIILWTCRCGEKLTDAVELCKNFGLEFDAINENLPETIEKYGSESRKISVDYYFDDRAFNKFKQEV